MLPAQDRDVFRVPHTGPRAESAVARYDPLRCAGWRLSYIQVGGPTPVKIYLVRGPGILLGQRGS